LNTKPDPAAVIANLEVLTSRLRAFFETEADYAVMQDRYVGALQEIANFLQQSGVDEDIAHKFTELASAIFGLRSGAVANFLRPAAVGGRGPDWPVVWELRKCVVIGLECILRSKKMKKQEAVDYITRKFPIFNRLKRNSDASLPTSIVSWHRIIMNDEPDHILSRSSSGGEQGDVQTLDKFFELHDLSSDEMFARGERALASAAEWTAKAAL
jgi:hypothetical protein